MNAHTFPTAQRPGQIEREQSRKIVLNPNGVGDWIAYSLREGVGVVRHRGTASECVDAVLQHPEPPLYVRMKPARPANLSGAAYYGRKFGG